MQFDTVEDITNERPIYDHVTVEVKVVDMDLLVEKYGLELKELVILIALL